MSFKWHLLIWIGYVHHVGTHMIILNYFIFLLPLTKQCGATNILSLYFISITSSLFLMMIHLKSHTYYTLASVRLYGIRFTFIVSQLVQYNCQILSLCPCICVWAAVFFVKITLKVVRDCCKSMNTCIDMWEVSHLLIFLLNEYFHFSTSYVFLNAVIHGFFCSKQLALLLIKWT